jgi:hypothetical protein
MFCAPVLIFDGTEGVVSRFHVLRSRTHFRRYRGRLFAFSCFALPDSFSVVPRSSGSVFMFCVPGVIFNGTEGMGSHFHVLRSPTHFLRYRGRRVPFSCFALPNSFSAVSSVGSLFHVLCVGSRSHVLRARTHFGQYRGCQVPFSCIALPDSFSAAPWASGPIIMFCASRLILSGAEYVGSRFQVLDARTHFRRSRGRPVPFSCFTLPVPFSCFALLESFPAVPRVSGPDLMFCTPGLVSRRNEGIGSRFHVLRARTRFRLCRGRRVPLSSFRRPYSFSAVPWASGPVFMFYAPGPVFIFCAPRVVSRSTEGVRS